MVKIKYVETFSICLPQQVGQSGQGGTEGQEEEGEEGEEPQRQLDCSQAFPDWGTDRLNEVAEGEGDGESY